ncbi:MAG: hypothetical protein HOP36_05725 [Methyloglobulus sp.]|nr:hypothetical protein [Methyloglobulus sp.]
MKFINRPDIRLQSYLKTKSDFCLQNGRCPYTDLQKNVSGVSFVTTDFKSHHDRSLTHWDMVDGEGNRLAQGASYGLYGADGRLTQMSGFFGPPTD